jgi:hypothetical protein
MVDAIVVISIIEWALRESFFVRRVLVLKYSLKNPKMKLRISTDKRTGCFSSGFFKVQLHGCMNISRVLFEIHREDP